MPAFAVPWQVRNVWICTPGDRSASFWTLKTGLRLQSEFSAESCARVRHSDNARIRCTVASQKRVDLHASGRQRKFAKAETSLRLQSEFSAESCARVHYSANARIRCTVASQKRVDLHSS